MVLSVDELTHRSETHGKRLDGHDNDILALRLWQAQVKGFLLALTIFASLPTVILGWMALSGQLK